MQDHRGEESKVVKTSFAQREVSCHPCSCFEQPEYRNRLLQVVGRTRRTRDAEASAPLYGLRNQSTPSDREERIVG